MTPHETDADRKTWRVLDLINWTTEYLAERDFESPKSDVEWMLCAVLDCRRVQLYTDFAKPLTPGELAEFKGLLKQRLERKPVQYIIGETEFMGFPFRVNESVLIPRPETELLTERAVDWLRARPSGRTVLDIGTGSGCIAVSIARLVDEVSVDAVEISEDALALAQTNAGENGVTDRIRFTRLDILTAEPPRPPYDLVVSNPPYVTEEELASLAKDVREYEPAAALTARGDDPHIFYRRFAGRAHQWLKPDGLFLVEISGTHQAETVREIFSHEFWSGVTLHTDYNGEYRILQASPVHP